MKSKKIVKVFIIVLLGLIFLLGMTGDVKAADSEGNLVIVLDPGHGGKDPGAIGGKLREDQVNFKIAYYAKQELEQYEGVKVYLTRYNDCPSIYDRVEIAKSYNADLLVSLHTNSGASGARGAAIWVTQDDTQIEYKAKATEVGNTILYHIGDLGVQNNGIQIRSGKPDEWYDSGVVQDYYGIIRYAQRVKLRSLLVEHCFISNANDREYINSDEKLRKMAQADVKGIVEAYRLQKKGQGFIPIKTMDMEQQELNLQIQDNDLQPVTYLNPIINPINASNQEMEWYSSNPEVVRVWNGRIRGLQQGEAVIKAISKNNQRIATCKVIVTKPKVPLQNITTTTAEQTVNIDETGDVYIDFYPNDCDDKILYWKSSNPEIVRVWHGHYRGLKEGISIITAYSRAGGKQASCKVKVKDPNRVYVENMEFEKEEYTVDIDEAINLPFTYLPSNSENAEFIWSSSNPEILRVSNNRFRGLKEGTAEVIAQTTDGMFEKRIKVTVKNINKPYVQNVEIEKEKYVINIDEAVDLPFTYTPINSKNAEFVWDSSNPEILRVWHNRFRGLKEGTAEVIVKTFDGKYEKKIKVVVKNPNKKYVENMEFEKEEYTVDIDEAINLPFTYLPSDSENAEFIWSSSNPEILRVCNNRFRGLKEGIAEVIVQTTDEIFEKRIKVTVKNLNKSYVQNVEIEKEKYVINIDEAVDLPFTYTPINSKNAEFVWNSSNPEILRVWHNRFRGLKEGTAEVIVKTFDGRYEKKIKVVVKNPNKMYVEDVKLEQNEFTVKVNEAIDLPYSYSPSQSENAEFIWSSSNPEILRVWNNRFRGLKEGTAYVVVKTVDEIFEKKIKVNVEK